MLLENEGLSAVLDRLNRGRLGLQAVGEAEEIIERLFKPSRKLAIYGTLAPGKVNHHQIADLGGDWCDAALRGETRPILEGAHKGLPGLRLDLAASPVPVKLLQSAKLPAAWARLDAFEGPEIQRLLAMFEQDGELLGVANVYAVRSVMAEMLA